MTVEEMISDQDKFAQQVRDRCSQEMESFGLVIDSFQIQEITSPSSYIENLAVPHQAEVEQNARIARANADREAVAAGAGRRRPRSPRRSATRRSRRPASRPRSTRPTRTPRSRARSPQATARQAVVEEETKVAELQAQQTEQQLQVDVRKPADAEAYRQTTLAAAAPRRPHPPGRGRGPGGPAARRGGRCPDAGGSRGGRGATKIQAEAQAGATRLNGQAEADAIRARGIAEADAVRARMEAEAAGIERRAAALSQNQEAVIAQQIAENLPEIVRAAASSVRARRQLHGPQRRRRASPGPWPRSSSRPVRSRRWLGRR